MLTGAFFGAEEPIEMIDVLLAAGANVNATDYSTPLISAAQVKSIEIVKRLISAGADVNITGNGLTALMVASYYEGEKDKARAVAIVKELLNADADVNIQGDGCTALKCALDAEENIDIVTMLLEAGANPNVRDGHDNTMLSLAIVWGGNVAIVEKLITFGVDVNAKSQWGHTELMTAVGVVNKKKTADCIAIVKVLLMAGAEVNAKQINGARALDFADEGIPELITLLREAGAVGRDEVEE